MATYVALLRAVNVAGTGKLAMSALRDLCEGCGFRSVRTYIASGNVVFDADGAEAEVQAKIQRALHQHVGKPVGVLIRSAAQLRAVLAANPYPERAPNLVHVIFLDGPTPTDLLAGVSGRAGEEIAPGPREIYVHYPQGQGASKLKLPAAKAGTARNINTVAKLADLAEA
jgi:uncharacterized protein (DUF1697 family)